MIKLNDPRITAYLLGELDPSEVEVIEQALKSSPTLAKNVDQMRQTIELLKLALPEEGMILPSQISEPATDSVPINASHKAVPSKGNKWLAFLWKSSIAFFAGLVLYFLCQPGIEPIPTSKNDSSSALSTQTTDGSSNFEPQFSFDPVDTTASQSAPDNNWEEYGLTPEQVEKLSQEPEQPNAQETDLIAMFPLEAVNETERMNAYRDLHNPDGWQFKSFAPKGSSADSQSAFFGKLVIENPIENVSDKPKSSFGLVPETVSWRILQSSLNDSGTLPSSQTVRAEQYINHFHYPKLNPLSDNSTFSLSVRIGVHPWASGMLLAAVSVRTQDGSKETIVAKDASVEISFNPETVKAYRLIGWEKRLTSEQTTPYQPVKSAQIAAGSEVVALYELALTDNAAESFAAPNSNLFAASITYQKPDSTEPQTQALNVDIPSPQALEQTNADPEFRFVAAVALFAQLLQKSEYAGTGDFNTVKSLLQNSDENDPQVKEFVELVRQVSELHIKRTAAPTPNDAPLENKP